MTSVSKACEQIFLLLTMVLLVHVGSVGSINAFHEPNHLPVDKKIESLPPSLLVNSRFLVGSSSNLKAYSVQLIADSIKNENFVYVGRKIMSGYYSTESCLWTSPSALIIQHYCHDSKTYPARSLTIWTKDFGALEIYEEDMGSFFKRDLRLNAFASHLSPVLPDNLNSLNIDEVDQMKEDLYKRFEPACWSTNINFNTDSPDANCYLEDIKNFPDWDKETQAIVNAPNLFNLYYKGLQDLVSAKP